LLDVLMSALWQHKYITMRDFQGLCSAPKMAAARALARALENLRVCTATSDTASPPVITNLSSRSSQGPNIYKKS
jgi:hypothetical protein